MRTCVLVMIYTIIKHLVSFRSRILFAYITLLIISTEDLFDPDCDKIKKPIKLDFPYLFHVI